LSDYVVDASVVIKWFLPEPDSEAARRLRRADRRSVYDCTYLAMAIQEDCRLVTADRRFYDALKNGPFASRLLWVGDLQEPT
jgi:predicted nucleic acid-binding protein